MASWLLPSVLACLMGTGILLIIYSFLYLKYGKQYLGLWTLAWGFYFARFLFMLAMITSGTSDLLLIANQEATLASGLLLLAGTYSFAGRKLPPSWLLVGGVAAAWIWAATLLDFDFMLLTLPTFAFIGLTQIWTGIVFMRVDDLSAFARYAPGLTLIVWGLHKLDYPFLRGVEAFAPWGYVLGAFCAFFLAVSFLLGYFERFRNEVLHKDQLFRGTFDQAALGLAHISASGTWQRLNRRFSEILDRIPEDVLGMTARMYVHPDDVGTFEKLLRAAREGRQTGSREMRLVRRAGHSVWTNITISFLEGMEDGGGYYVVAAEDISRRKTVESRLRESESKYRLLVDNVSVGVCVAQEDRLVFVNPVMERLTDRSGAELLNRPFWEFIHPEDRKRVRRNHERRVLGEDPEPRYSFRLVDARGRIRNVEISSVLFEWGGKAATLNFLTDITDRVAQDEKNRSIARFPEENPNPVMRINQRGIPVYANPAARASFQIQQERSSLPESLLNAVALALSSGRIRSVDALVGEDTYQFMLVPLPESREVNVYGMNVTPRVKVEQELVRARDRARTANKAKNEFLANISHEIRTPINGVIGMLQLLEEMDMTPQQKEYLSMALESGQSLMTILNDLLQLATADTAGVRLESQPLSVAEQLKVVSGVFGNHAREKQLELTMECDESVPQWVLGDSGRIRQVLFNLVGNAIKFSMSGTVSVWVSLLQQGRGRDRTLLMIISDEGPGFPEDRIEHAFQPFTQMDASSSREFGGVGLGLGIVKKLVFAMGGTICVDSAVGKGTDMYVTIKVRGMRREQVDTAVKIARPLPALRVLLVEDERISMLGTVQFMKSRGLEVETAGNGLEALEILGKQPFDCVLMDIQMPLLDGISAVRKLRAGEAGELNRHVPVVALTAHVLNGDTEYLEAGMDAYLSKPVVFEEMIRLVEELAGAEA